MRNESNKYLLSRGFIDGMDNKARRLFGAFVVVMCNEKLIYQGELFSFRATDQEMPWADLINFLDAPKPELRNEDLPIYENNLRSYIELNKFFQTGPYPIDAKALERKFIQFCDEILRIKSIVFIDLNYTSKEGLFSLVPSFRAHSFFEDSDDNEEPVNPTDEVPPPEGENKRDESVKEVFMMLEPVLDPVIGIAAGDLSIGENVLCRLPADSLYYSFFDGCIPDFNGTVKGEVTGINITEYGSVIVSINLTDGLSGIMKAPRWIRIRTAQRALTINNEEKKGMTFEILAAGVGTILFLLAMSLLVYFMS